MRGITICRRAVATKMAQNWSLYSASKLELMVIKFKNTKYQNTIRILWKSIYMWCHLHILHLQILHRLHILQNILHMHIYAEYSSSSSASASTTCALSTQLFARWNYYIRTNQECIDHLINSCYQNWLKIVTLLIGVHCMHRLVLLRFIACFGKKLLVMHNHLTSWRKEILRCHFLCQLWTRGQFLRFQKLCPDCRGFHVRQFLNPKTLRTFQPAQCLVLASTAAKRLRRFEAVVQTASKARGRILVVHYDNSDISDVPIFLVLQHQF